MAVPMTMTISNLWGLTMIDFFDVRFPAQNLDFIGKSLTTQQPSGALSHSFTEQSVGYDDTRAPKIKLKFNSRSNELRLWGCPLRWLQGQNGLGSNDLPFLVESASTLVFKHLKRPVPESIRLQLRDRSYRVAEVHVAELHRMPHGLIPAFCDSVRRHAPAALHATPSEKGIGVRLWPDSRERQVLMYDKHHYFWDGMLKHRLTLLGKLPLRSWERLGPALNFSRMMDEHLNQGIRIETRHLRNLKTHGLAVGSAWQPGSARQLHYRVLGDVPLTDLPPLTDAEMLLKLASQEDRRLLALWIDGRPMAQFFDSDSTYARWHQRILRTHGIDIKRAPVPCDAARWTNLITPQAVLDTPDWAVESAFVCDTSQAVVGRIRPAAALAWPVAP